MSSSVKKEKITPRDTPLLNFSSDINLTDAFLVAKFNRHKNFIYLDTKNINFKNTLPEFQKIMKQEFKETIKFLDFIK